VHWHRAIRGILAWQVDDIAHLPDTVTPVLASEAFQLTEGGDPTTLASGPLYVLGPPILKHAIGLAGQYLYFMIVLGGGCRRPRATGR
jgi:hypothetical protein